MLKTKQLSLPTMWKTDQVQPTAPETLTTCLNCNATNVEAFCPRCGQECGQNIAPIREMMQDAAGEFLHWDGKLIATLKGLLKPGFLTVQYLAGRRASYITPLRVYLWVSALYFVAFSATVQKDMEAQFSGAKAGMQSSFQQQMDQGAQLGAGIARGATVSDRPPAKSGKLSPAEKMKKMQAAMDVTKSGVSSVMANLATIMLFVLLVESGLLYLLYRRRQPLFAPHLITVVHVNAALLLITCPLLFWRDKHGMDSLLMMSLQPPFYFMALRRIYGGANGETWRKTLAKTALWFLMMAFIGSVVMLSAGAILGVLLATNKL